LRVHPGRHQGYYLLPGFAWARSVTPERQKTPPEKNLFSEIKKGKHFGHIFHFVIPVKAKVVAKKIRNRKD
jgi:hypothetical protein